MSRGSMTVVVPAPRRARCAPCAGPEGRERSRPSRERVCATMVRRGETASAQEGHRFRLSIYRPGSPSQVRRLRGSTPIVIRLFVVKIHSWPFVSAQELDRGVVGRHSAGAASSRSGQSEGRRQAWCSRYPCRRSASGAEDRLWTIDQGNPPVAANRQQDVASAQARWLLRTTASPARIPPWRGQPERPEFQGRPNGSGSLRRSLSVREWVRRCVAAQRPQMDFCNAQCARLGSTRRRKSRARQLPTGLKRKQLGKNGLVMSATIGARQSARSLAQAACGRVRCVAQLVDGRSHSRQKLGADLVRSC